MFAASFYPFEDKKAQGLQCPGKLSCPDGPRVLASHLAQALGCPWSFVAVTRLQKKEYVLSNSFVTNFAGAAVGELTQLLPVEGQGSHGWGSRGLWSDWEGQ